MLKPMNDHVVVEISKPEERTESGLFLPSNSKGEKNQKGTVVAVGPGKFSELLNSRVPMTVKVGNTVLMNWGGTEVEVDRVKYRVIKEDDIIALVG